MTKGLTWAVSSVVVALGMMTANGCVLNLGNSGSGGTSSTGTGTGHGTTGSGDTVVVPKPVPVPSDCDESATDDPCTACQKASCCTELTGCNGDDSCIEAYNKDYRDCLFPDGQNWSGYSVGYCKASAAAASETAAGRLIDCNVSKCDKECSGLPENTWTNFAAEFMEGYCGGCHFTGYTGPSGQNTADYSTDSSWSSPFGGEAPGPSNAEWFSWMNYETVKIDGSLIWCGVSEVLPSDCDPARFSKAQRFPPAGKGSPDPQGAPLHCWWTSDSSCAQPTLVERAKLSSWVFDGMPK